MPVALENVLKLKSGKANVGMVTSSLEIPQELGDVSILTSSKVVNTSNNFTNSANGNYVPFQFDITAYDFKGKTNLGLYPFVSSHMTARYPELARQLEMVISNYKEILNFKLHLKVHDIFLVIFDHDVIKNYENMFTLLMKVGGRLLVSSAFSIY